MNHVYKERFPKVMAMGGTAASVPSRHPGSFCRKITYLCWNIGCMNRYGGAGGHWRHGSKLCGSAPSHSHTFSGVLVGACAGGESGVWVRHTWGVGLQEARGHEPQRHHPSCLAGYSPDGGASAGHDQELLFQQHSASGRRSWLVTAWPSPRGPSSLLATSWSCRRSSRRC